MDMKVRLRFNIMGYNTSAWNVTWVVGRNAHIHGCGMNSRMAYRTNKLSSVLAFHRSEKLHGPRKLISGSAGALWERNLFISQKM